MRRDLYPAVCIGLLLAVSGCGYYKEIQLENACGEMKGLFSKKDYYGIYDKFADDILKEESLQCVQLMRKDTVNGPEIASRLEFSSPDEYYAAKADTVIQHFFGAMNRPAASPKPVLENLYYMQLCLSLSLLVAPYGPKMQVIKKELNENRAEIVYGGDGIVLISHYRLRQGKWTISASPEITKVGSEEK